MPAKCCVPGCKSNYKSSKEHGYVSVFKFPADEERRKRWLKCIPRGDWKHTDRSVVCIKHFDERDVSKVDVYRDSDGNWKEFPRHRPLLLPKAVPKIFPGLPSYLSKMQTPQRCDPEMRRKRACQEEGAKNEADKKILFYVVDFSGDIRKVKARQRVRKPLLSSRDKAASSSETASELEESLSLPQPTTTTSSSAAKEKAPASPPAKVMRLANDADDTVPEAEVPQSAQLDFWENQKLVATLGKSLVTLQNVATEVAKTTTLRSTQIAPEGSSNSVQQTICDPRCVELQCTLAALGNVDEIFVKLGGIISDSQPGTEFYNPKAAVIMNLIQDYTSLY